MTAESLLFVVWGPFDGAVAQRIREQLRELPREQPVTIDFTRAQIPSLCILTAFFDALSRLPPRTLEARGLSDHHRTVLRYCGIDLDALGWVSVDRPLAA